MRPAKLKVGLVLIIPFGKFFGQYLLISFKLFFKKNSNFENLLLLNLILFNKGLRFLIPIEFFR